MLTPAAPRRIRALDCPVVAVMVDTRITELKKDQDTTHATVSDLVNRLEVVIVPRKDLQGQNNNNWEGVQLQLKVIGNATHGKNRQWLR